MLFRSLLILFVSGAYALLAQNISPATQFATTIAEIKLPLVHTGPAAEPAAAEMMPSSYYIGENYKGTWMSFYTNGNRCDSGFLSDNRPDGLWRGWYPNGQLRMEMNCSAKKLTAAKDEMQRIYRPGFTPPPGTLQMKYLMASSTYPYEKLAYRLLYYAIHPPEIEKSYREIQVTVQSGEKTNSFQTDSPPFTECLVHGVYRSWFENGALKDSGYCDNGIREGVWEEWDDSVNMRAVGFYKHGMRWKDWRYYNKEGKLEYIKLYNRLEEVTETIVLK